MRKDVQMKMNLLLVLAINILAIEQSNYATPLMDAVKKNNVSEVQKFIKSGADVNEKDDYGETALHFAADMGAVDIAKILIQHGANVNAKDRNGSTPLMAASWASPARHMKNKTEREKLFNDEAEIVKLLLEHGALVDEKNVIGTTALMNAARSTLKIAMLLIKHGADVNAKDNNGGTALINAVNAGKPDIVELLIKHKADVNAKNHDGETAIIMASLVPQDPAENQVEKAKNFDDATKLVKLLIDNGADVNAKTADGWTALMFASISGAMGVAKLLIDEKADLTAKNSGKTALDYAKGANNVEIVALIEAKMTTSK